MRKIFFALSLAFSMHAHSAIVWENPMVTGTLAGGDCSFGTTCGGNVAGTKYGAQLFTITGVPTPVTIKAASFEAMIPTSDYCAQPAYANWMILSKNAVTGAPERVLRWGTSLIKKRKNPRLIGNNYAAEFMFNLPGDYASDYLGPVALNGSYYLAVQAVDRVSVYLAKGTHDSGAFTLGNVTKSWSVPEIMYELPPNPLSVESQKIDPSRITAKYGPSFRSVAMKLYNTTADEDTPVDTCGR